MVSISEIVLNNIVQLELTFEDAIEYAKQGCSYYSYCEEYDYYLFHFGYNDGMLTTDDIAENTLDAADQIMSIKKPPIFKDLIS